MITKGKWEIQTGCSDLGNTGDYIYYMNVTNGVEHICSMPIEDEDEEIVKANAELIALAGNLAQKYNLEKLPELIEIIKEIYPDLEDEEWVGNVMAERLKQALKDIEK